VQELFVFVNENLSGAKRRKSATREERGAGKGAQSLSLPQDAVAPERYSRSGLKLGIISTSRWPSRLTRAQERKRYAFSASFGLAALLHATAALVA